MGGQPVAGIGRSTLLRLIAHKIFCQEGFVFIPTHLRILHVSQDPVLLHLSVWKNLTFGDVNATWDRVKKILDLLTLDNFTIEAVKAEMQNDLKEENGEEL